MKIAVIALAALTLAGCQSTNRIWEYEKTVHRITMPDDTYRILEHPTENVLLTTPSIGTATAAGLASGLTLGVASGAVRTREQLHEDAARAWLDQTGRQNCQITRGYLLAEPQYEFWFECPA